MKKIYLIIIILILLIILGILFWNTQRMNELGLSLEYINSDEISEEIKSPTNIHVVLAKYKGKIKPKTISKFSYNFAYNIIPSYADLIKQGKIKIDDKLFYFVNKDLILAQTGIDNYDEFNELIKKISVLNGNLEVESYIIPISSVNPGMTELEAQLNIKYKDNEQISFYFKLGSVSDEEMTGIKIL